jgi:hypothetical protein
MAGRVEARPVLLLIPRDVRIPKRRPTGRAATQTVRRSCNGVHARKRPDREQTQGRLWSVDSNGQ